MTYPKHARLSQASYYFYRDLLISQLYNTRVKDKHSVTIGYGTKIAFEDINSFKHDSYPDVTLSYQDNQILLIKPDSMSFTSVDWYHTRTTKVKLDNYSPKRVYFHPDIWSELKKDYDFIGLNYIVDIPTFTLDVHIVGNDHKIFIFKVGNVNSTNKLNFTPLYEGLTVKTNKHKEEVGIPEYDSLLNYLSYKAMLVDNKLFLPSSEQKLFTDLFIDSVIKNKNYQLLVNTQRYLPNNTRRAFIFNVDTNRYQSKLTEKFTPAINKWLENYNIFTNNPYYLEFQIDGKCTGESISKMKILDHIINSKQSC